MKDLLYSLPFIPSLYLDSQAAIRKFIEDKITRGAALRDKEKIFPKNELKEMGKLGWMGVLIPEQYLGIGQNNVFLSLLSEELAAADFSCSTLLSSHNTLFCPILHKYGSEEVKKDYLKASATGSVLGAFSITEASSGSDAFRMRTSARKDGEDWIIDGSKNFVTAGKDADFVIVFADVSEQTSRKGDLSPFLIPTNSNGYTVLRVEETFGLKATRTSHISLDNIRLPKKLLIGNLGEGRAIAAEALVRSRIGIAAQANGLASAALKKALEYSRVRESFGKPIVMHQAVAHRLAEMATQIEASRSLTLISAHQLDLGMDVSKRASMAKLFASEVVEKVTSEAMQILGAFGYILDNEVERMYRDARVCSIYEGTSDIQKSLITNQLLMED